MGNVLNFISRLSQKEAKAKIIASLNMMRGVESGKILPGTTEFEEIVSNAKKCINQICNLAGFEDIESFAEKMSKVERERLEDCYIISRKITPVMARREAEKLKEEEEASNIYKQLGQAFKNLPMFTPTISPVIEYKNGRIKYRMTLLGFIKFDGERPMLLVDDCKVKTIDGVDYFSESSIGVLPPSAFVFKNGKVYLSLNDTQVPVIKYYTAPANTGIEIFDSSMYCK